MTSRCSFNYVNQRSVVYHKTDVSISCAVRTTIAFVLSQIYVSAAIVKSFERYLQTACFLNYFYRQNVRNLLISGNSVKSVSDWLLPIMQRQQVSS